MHWLKRIRFALLSIVGAAVSAASGCTLIYLAMNAWQAGQLRMKSGLITPSTDPITFAIFTGGAGVLGVLLIVLSPLLLLKIFAPSSEQSRFATDSPGLYGKTRPALFWILVALLALFGYALLIKPGHAIPAGSYSGLPTSVKDGHVMQPIEGCAAGPGRQAKGRGFGLAREERLCARSPYPGTSHEHSRKSLAGERS